MRLVNPVSLLILTSALVIVGSSQGAASAKDADASKKAPGAASKDKGGAAQSSAKGGKGAAQAAAKKAQVFEFSAVWCVPCKKFAPTFEKLEKQYAGKADFANVDMDDKAKADIVNKYNVDSVPTLIIVDGHGKVIYRHSGIPAEADLTAELNKL